MKLKLNKHKSYIVAEIGWNFLGNLSLAKKMITMAKKSGADAVKFQIWNPKYLKKGPWDKDGRKKDGPDDAERALASVNKLCGTNSMSSRLLLLRAHEPRQC